MLAFEYWIYKFDKNLYVLDFQFEMIQGSFLPPMDSNKS